MTLDTDAAPSTIRRSLAKNRLGIFTIACFVLSAAAPVTVVAGVIPTGFAVTNILGIPLAFLVIGAVLALFSVGFNAMSRRISNSGAFYAYIAQGLGRPLGVAAAVVAAIAYNLLQVGLYGIVGVAVAPLLNPLFAADVAWWVYALGAWAIVAVLGWRRVDLNGRILAFLMLAEIMLVVVYAIANLANPAEGTGLDFSGFDPSNLAVPGVGALFVIAILGFVGFEASAIFSEEAKDPARTVPRATYLCLAVIAVLYALSAWAMTVTTGPDQIGAVAAENPGETLFTLAAANLGAGWAELGHILFASSVFAAMVSYHNFVGRYMFSLGREGVLPAVFGATTRAGAPKWGSVFQSGIGLLVIVAFAIGGLDPLVQLFLWGGTTGAFGVLILLTATSIAVIGYHLRNRGETVWQGLVAPGLALIALLFIVYTAATNFDLLLGVPADSAWRWIFPASYVGFTAIGLVWALVLRETKPDTYQTIGLGANSITGRASIVDDQPGAHELGSVSR